MFNPYKIYEEECMNTIRRCLTIVFIEMLFMAALDQAASAEQSKRILTAEDYAHAEKFLRQHTGPLVFGASVSPIGSTAALSGTAMIFQRDTSSSWWMPGKNKEKELSTMKNLRLLYPKSRANHMSLSNCRSRASRFPRIGIL